MDEPTPHRGPDEAQTARAAAPGTGEPLLRDLFEPRVRSEARGETPSYDPNVGKLISSAARWMRLALTGWADEDDDVVTMLAPVAVEHLGKAALWSRSPALLVPLASHAEESLRILTDRPDLANARLRTIGLSVVLQRLERCLLSFPLSKEGARELVETRNGAIHVGARGRSESLLRDALSVCDAMLADLESDPREFYGDQYWNARDLLDKKRSEVEARVAAKLARARNHLTVLEERLGNGVFAEATTSLETDARFAIDPADFSSLTDTIAIDYECPECGSKGRLIGRLDAVPEVDWDVEKVGDSYESYPVGVYRLLRFSPQSFECNVCKLPLSGQDELAAARLPASTYDLDPGDLDDDFNIDQFARLHEDYD
jgi:hypothetical protein